MMNAGTLAAKNNLHRIIEMHRTIKEVAKDGKFTLTFTKDDDSDKLTLPLGTLLVWQRKRATRFR